jgi:putative membrane protein
MRLLARLTGVAALLAAASWTAAAQNTKGQRSSSSDLPLDDKTFVTKVAEDGKHEVLLGQMAKNQAANPEIRKFGERMITDHTKANEQLIAAAKAANIPVPAGISEEQFKHVEKLKNLKGAEFDKAYAKHMLEDHEKAVKMFENASKNLKDAGLRAFAAKTLPTLKEHLQMAKKISGGTTGK